MIDLIVHLAILFAIVAIAALALNLTLGWAGLINLGHAGFLAIGAYTSAIVTTRYQWPIMFGILLAIIITAIVATLLAMITDKLKGDSLGIVLLGFNLVTYSVALNWTSLTRGPFGIPGIPHFAMSNYLLIVFGFLLMSILLIYRINNSSFGRVLGAIRDDELHAKVLGKRTFRVKIITFTISGALAGLAGALQAHQVLFVDPRGFFLDMLVLILSIIFIGGLASLPGTIVGAAIMTLLPEIVDELVNLSDESVGAIRAIIFSLLLLLVVMYRPKGLFGKVELPSSYADRD
jgi:branched-chain amino acid transport system permease protein